MARLPGSERVRSEHRGPNCAKLDGKLGVGLANGIVITKAQEEPK
jgi:hypothetical protein